MQSTATEPGGIIPRVKTAPAVPAVPAFLRADDDRFQTAGGHFARFFEELGHSFLEREQLIGQFALALLSRQHLLMTGPPGTAKSQLASAVLGRIVDESTGKPSLFARQFTENTVQTDLIGPIDFKTLVEKGRTEHFTDEGMLGEVHAFLDEVFDGRDMMLRSTLNLLLERELKQGGRTTKGRIECAFMTSNRYIAEVLESSRDVLLAFLDRIAFVNFVPRGFADTELLATVVRRQAGGRGRGKLVSPLSIQDLDVLQTAVDSVYVSDSICNALVALIESLDAEFAVAARADPHFSPTRYFSTRTAVRAVHVLRAIAVYDKVFHHPERLLEVKFTDLEMLHLHLLLGGLPPEKIAQRLTRETDPRERRQLEIARTEREIFDRCLRKLPAVPDAPELRPTLNLADLERLAADGIADRNAKGLVYAARELARAASSGESGADRAAELLSDVMGNLYERALRAGISPVDTGQLLSLVEQLSTLADGLESASPHGRATARWLRGRAMEMIDEAGTIAPEGTLQTIATISAHPNNTVAISAQVDARMLAAEALGAARRHLEGSGADIVDAEASAAAWKRAVSRLEEEQAILCDALLMASASAVLAKEDRGTLSQTLAALAPAISIVDALALRLQALAGEPTTLKTRVFAPRMKPLVSAAFENMTVSGREAVVAEVRAIRDQIERSGLGSVIDPAAAIGWAASALVRNDTDPKAPPEGPRTQSGFDALRASEGQISSLDALIDIAISLQPDTSRKLDAPSEALASVMALLRTIPRDVANRIATRDLDRISTEVRYLEEWWSGLRADEPLPDLGVFEDVVQSGLLRVLRSEAVLVSLPRAARDIADAFPEHGAAAAGIERRISSLDAACTGALIAALKGKVDASWAGLFQEQGGVERRPGSRSKK